MNATLLSAPASEPVTLAEAKTWLRVDTDDEDAPIVSLISAARGAVETAARRALLFQAWRLAFDAWPSQRFCAGAPLGGIASPTILPLPLPQIASVTQVRILDATGAGVSVAPLAYQLVGAPNAARLIFASAPPQPGLTCGGIEVDVVAGFGATAQDVPQPLRQAILMLVANWFEHRGDDEDARMHLPAPVAALVAPFRRLRLA